jgi:hypothetical protein
MVTIAIIVLVAAIIPMSVVNANDCKKQSPRKNFFDYQISGELGNKGTTTDLSIYDRKTQDAIYTRTTLLLALIASWLC